MTFLNFIHSSSMISKPSEGTQQKSGNHVNDHDSYLLTLYLKFILKKYLQFYELNKSFEKSKVTYRFYTITQSSRIKHLRTKIIKMNWIIISLRTITLIVEGILKFFETFNSTAFNSKTLRFSRKTVTNYYQHTRKTYGYKGK